MELVFLLWGYVAGEDIPYSVNSSRHKHNKQIHKCVRDNGFRSANLTFTVRANRPFNIESFSADCAFVNSILSIAFDADLATADARQPLDGACDAHLSRQWLRSVRRVQSRSRSVCVRLPADPQPLAAHW